MLVEPTYVVATRTISCRILVIVKRDIIDFTSTPIFIQVKEAYFDKAIMKTIL
jgi:hypothetical protein